MVVVGAASPQSRGTPTGIIIGRQPRIRKGFVIALTNRGSLGFHDGGSDHTVAIPKAERSRFAELRGRGRYSCPDRARFGRGTGLRRAAWLDGHGQAHGPVPEGMNGPDRGETTPTVGTDAGALAGVRCL